MQMWVWDVTSPKTQSRRKRRKWQLLRYESCLGSGAVSAFLPEMPGLRTCKPLVLCFSSWVFVINFFIFSFSSYHSEAWLFRPLLPCVPESCLPCLYPGLRRSMTNSQHELATFNCWIYSLCERETQRGTGIRDSRWDVVWCWDLWELGETRYWVYMWMQFQLFTS